MSHLTNILSNEPINDALSIAELFGVDVIIHEYSELIQYLTFQTFHPIFTEKIKKRLILKSLSYTMNSEALYKEGKDEIL